MLSGADPIYLIATDLRQASADRERRALDHTLDGDAAPIGNAIIETDILRVNVARMQRTHDRRRASFFVGPPGIGKSTAVERLRADNPGAVIVTQIVKRGATGPQVLQQLLLALRAFNGVESRYVTSATTEIMRYLNVEIEKAGGGLPRTADPDQFPHLTVVFDEAQRLTNGAIDALRDYNEPHYRCRGTFPIGMIFVGNNELSLEAKAGGISVLDEGMRDRLLYRERLSYDDVTRADIEAFVRAHGIERDDAVTAIGAAFAAPRMQRSFRRIGDFVAELRDEARGASITAQTVRDYLALV